MSPYFPTLAACTYPQPHLADSRMKPRTKAPRGYSACRISLIDSGRSFPGSCLCVSMAYRPIYIQLGQHTMAMMLLVLSNIIILFPCHSHTVHCRHMARNTDLHTSPNHSTDSVHPLTTFNQFDICITMIEFSLPFTR